MLQQHLSSGKSIRHHKPHIVNGRIQQHFHAAGRDSSSLCTRQRCAAVSVRQAGPSTEVPDYTAIDSQPLNQIVMELFRNKMVAAIGSDSQLSG